MVPLTSTTATPLRPAPPSAHHGRCSSRTSHAGTWLAYAPDVVRASRGVALTTGGKSLTANGRTRAGATSSRKKHHAKVYRRATDVWEARCWCQWSASGETAAEVSQAAQRHHDDEAVKATQAAAAAKAAKSKSAVEARPSAQPNSKRGPTAKPTVRSGTPATSESTGRASSSSPASESHRVLEITRGPEGWTAWCNNCSWQHGPVKKIDAAQAAARSHQASTSTGPPRNNGTAKKRSDREGPRRPVKNAPTTRSAATPRRPGTGTDHALRLTGQKGAWIVVCDCGWKSAPQRLGGKALTAARTHHLGRRA